MSKKSRSIELFLVDGDPDGMLTATIPFQWTGHVLVSSRTQLKQALEREEFARSGVYLLIGENDDGALQLYVGESDDIKKRIRDHDAKKEWWSKAIFITSNGEPLNKAHIRYLENKLIEQAKKANKIILENGNIPTYATLSEAAKAHMEVFLENIFLVLPTLKFDFFSVQTIDHKQDILSPTSSDMTIFELSTPRHGLHATAYLENGNFIVKKDSSAKIKWSQHQTTQTSYAKLFDELIEQNVLKREGDKCFFVQDYAFNSLSAAASIINGRSSNGPKEWKVQNTNKTYREWEEEQIKQV